MAKSLISHSGTLEFAKRYYWHGVDCSPIAFKEVIAAITSLSALQEFINKYALTLVAAYDIRGMGYRLKGQMHRAYVSQKKRIVVMLVELTYGVRPMDE